jgi:hypothetical protein
MEEITMGKNQNQENHNEITDNKKNDKADTIEIPVPEQAPDPGSPTSPPEINVSEGTI